MKRLISVVALLLVVAGTGYARTQKGGDEKKARSFTVTKGGTLDISVNGGDLRIATWEKNEVAVRVRLSDDEEEGSDVKMSQEGNTIRITDREHWNDIERLDVSVPVQFNLQLETANGDIGIRGRVTGDINGETSAGNITMEDVVGDVEMQTSGGDIRTGKITGKATLRTSGGEIEVVSSTGPLDLKSSGGDLRVGNVGKSLRAKTAGGDIVIGDVGGEATVATAGGNVRVGKVTGQASLTTAGGDVELSGGTGSILASTSGGNIMLSNLSGSVDARTSGGDIHAELIPSGKGKSRLSSSNGTIRLFLPASAKATITARIRIQGWWRTEQDAYEVRSDFKAESSSRDDDERAIESKYILNGGGESITLETVNSDIEIRKLAR